MQTTRLFMAAAGLVVLAAGSPLLAHHAFAAEFDGSKPVTLRGTITKMEWTNPHAWLHIDVKGADGKVRDSGTPIAADARSAGRAATKEEIQNDYLFLNAHKLLGKYTCLASVGT